ncbi:unnamed protein product [Dicrocoelium dendriticum]|nr:unnamed protein product [Dicrocoelium dendriticum]
MGTEYTKVVDFGAPRGKGIVATRTIKSGETIFTESPLICCQFSWNRLYGYLACDHCLCPLESAELNVRRLTGNPHIVLPHPNCESLTDVINPLSCPGCNVTYCTLTCLEEAAITYHSVICPKDVCPSSSHPILQLDETWRQLHYPPESSSIFLLVRIVGACLCAYLHGSTPSQKVVAALQTFVSSTTEPDNHSDHAHSVISHKLLRPEYVPSLQKLHDAFVNVLFHLTRQIESHSSEDQCYSLLQKAGCSDLLSFDCFKSALCLLGRNGQGVATSSFSLWAKGVQILIANTEDASEVSRFDAMLSELYTAMESHSGAFLDVEGVGLYNYQRLLNHSCSPNAMIQFTGANSRLAVVALQPIQPDEEITISYLESCQQARSRHSRRKLLSTNYLFWCECPLCEAEKLPAGCVSETSEDESDSEDGQDESCSEEALWPCPPFCCCFGESPSDENEEFVRGRPTPEDAELRRLRQAEAAERRIASSQARGIANPEGVKRKQQLAMEQELRASASPNTGVGLKWNVG